MKTAVPVPFRFVKMHGLGNDFVVIDDRSLEIAEEALPKLSRVLNDRRFGIGGDGLILLRPPSGGGHYAMRMFNPDGSEAEMCGNGIRCLAKYAFESGVCDSPSPVVETASGPLSLTLHLNNGTVSAVTVDMGVAKWRRREIPATGPPEEAFLAEPVELLGRTFIITALSIGNPHAVVFVADVESVPVLEWGPALETLPLFPNRTNVHFVQVLSRSEIVQRTWERGAGATLACGSGACACTAAGHKLGLLDGKVNVHLPGGDLRVEVGDGYRMRLTGPAATVFSGTVDPSLLEGLNEAS